MILTGAHYINHPERGPVKMYNVPARKTLAAALRQAQRGDIVETGCTVYRKVEETVWERVQRERAEGHSKYLGGQRS